MKTLITHPFKTLLYIGDKIFISLFNIHMEIKSYQKYYYNTKHVSSCLAVKKPFTRGKLFNKFLQSFETYGGNQCYASTIEYIVKTIEQNILFIW